MTRKPSQDMTKILAIHSEWLEANGYISISHLTKHKRRATTHTRNCQNKKHRRKLQDTRDTRLEFSKF